MAGNYLAFSYFAIALGAIAPGRVSDRFHNRRIPILIAGLVAIPLAYGMGRVNSVLELTILTALLWFCGGLGMGLIMILTGLTAPENERGKIFGILSLTSGSGALIGGLVSGWIVDQWGFATLFSTSALFLVFWPFSSWLLTEAKTKPAAGDDEVGGTRTPLGRNFYLLFSASLTASIASFVIVLGRSLLMNALSFNATSISITGAASGIIALPMPILMGWLSDRTGRKGYLYLAYLTCIASLSILAVSSALWQFAFALGLQAIFVGINSTIGNALVTDLVSTKNLGSALSMFSATSWTGGVLGFAGAGYAFQSLGVGPTFSISISLPLFAILLLVPIRTATRSAV